AEFRLPPLVQRLIDKGWVGEKSGQGFYKRQGARGDGSETSGHGSEVLTLDPATLTYRSRQQPRLPSLDAAQGIDDVGARIRTLLLGNVKAGRFLRATLGRTLLYTARVAPSIAYGIDDVDRAMRWGFGWDLGPFEIWDAIGVPEVLGAVSQNGPMPPLIS